MPTLEELKVMRPDLFDDSEDLNDLAILAMQQGAAGEAIPSKVAKGSIEDQFMQSYQNSIKQQQQQAENLRAMLAQQQLMESQKGILGNLDLRPFAQAAKQYGSTTAVVPTEGPEDTQDKLLKLQKAIQESEQGISKQQLDYLKAKAAEAKAGKASSLAQDVADRRDYRSLVRNVLTNKPLKDRIAQFQTLSNSLNTIQKTTQITPQDIHDLQQVIISNMGIRGQSTGPERTSRYLSSLGWKADEISQFLTGEAASISPNDPLLKKIKELARIESENIKGNVDKLIKASSAGYGNLLKRRPDFAEDLAGLVQAQQETVELPKESAGEAEDPMLKQLQETRARTEKMRKELESQK